MLPGKGDGIAATAPRGLLLGIRPHEFGSAGLLLLNHPRRGDGNNKTEIGTGTTPIITDPCSSSATSEVPLAQKLPPPDKPHSSTIDSINQTAQKLIQESSVTNRDSEQSTTTVTAKSAESISNVKQSNASKPKSAGVSLGVVKPESPGEIVTNQQSATSVTPATGSACAVTAAVGYSAIGNKNGIITDRSHMLVASTSIAATVSLTGVSNESNSPSNICTAKLGDKSQNGYAAIEATTDKKTNTNGKVEASEEKTEPNRTNESK